MNAMGSVSNLAARVDPALLKGALAIIRVLREAGFEAYFAGGVVRDLLLEKQVTDVDIATSAPPERVESLFDKTIPVGKQFGVVIVVTDSRRYEVTTFREDASYLNGRHPTSVRFSNVQEDAARRDFTINALFLDPVQGKILDFVKGRDDLAAGLIRTVGAASERFQEDKLRVLRAVRFACQLDFEIEPSTWEAVRSFSQNLRQVSRERIRDELLRVLTGPAPARGLRLLLDSGILEVILPEVARMVGVEQPPEFHPEGDVFTHTCLMFDHAGESARQDVLLALGILLHDIGKPTTFEVTDRIRFNRHAEVGAEMAEEICRRLRLSTEQTEAVVALVRDHLRFIHVKEMRESTLKRFLRRPDFRRHLELHRVDCLASHGDLTSHEFCLKKLEELGQEQMRPKAFLNGHDLISLGFTPGPLFSEILRGLEDQQLEGLIHTRRQAVEWVERNFPLE